MILSFLMGALLVAFSQFQSALDVALNIPDSLLEQRIQHLEKIVESTKVDPIVLAQANFQLAQDYRDIGFIDKGLDFLSTSFDIYYSLKDSASLSRVLQSSAVMYARIQEFEHALEALKDAERYALSIVDLKDIHSRLGYVYFNLYQLDSAEYYLNKSIIEHQEIQELPIGPMLNLCGVNVARHQFDQALKGLLELESIGLDKLSLQSQHYVLGFIAALYHRQGNETRSKAYQRRLEALEEKTEENMSLDFYETMASADTLLGDYKGATRYQQQYIKRFKELNNNNLSTQIANFQKLYELKEKEAEIRLLEKENQLISLRSEKNRFYLIIAGLSIVILLMGIIIVYRILVVRTSVNRQLTHLNGQITRQKEDLSEKNTLLEQTISDLKQTQNQLIRSEKRASIGVFVSGVAHELNNPINVVNGGLHVIEKNLPELLKNQSNSDLELLADLNVMLRESGRSIDKINKIIQALSMATYTDANPIEVDISQVIDNVLLGLDLYHFQDIKIVRDTPAQILECFPNRIHHALKNVLENALNFARKTEDPQPTVEITTWRSDDELKINISNNGPPILPDHLMKIFDPFFTTRQEEMSAGLGLYFAFSAFAEHHGNIEAFNHEGRVVFEMRLPLTMK